MARPAARLRPELEEFVTRCLTQGDLGSAASQLRMTQERLRFLLQTYANEAHVGLELIEGELSDSARILEVGCGTGILSAFLRYNGYDITGIEPGAAGFGLMPSLARIVADVVSAHDGPAFTPLPLDITDMKRANHGQFDLIFSVHVVEHLRDLEGSFAAMSELLAPRGRMVHMCPNYVVPYEPHLGIPLVPFAMHATAYVFASRVSRDRAVWESLNFVTASRVRRIASRLGLQLTLRPSVLGAFLARLDHDPLFFERHRGVVTSTYALAKRVGLVKLMNRIPAHLATPMIIEICKKDTLAPLVTSPLRTSGT